MYFLRFRSATRLAFGGWKEHQQEKPAGIALSFLGDKAEVIVFDERTPTSPKLHYGLGFDIQLDAANIEEAQRVAEAIVNDIIGLLSFSESCYLGEVELLLRYRLPEKDKILTEFFAAVVDRDRTVAEISLRVINRKRVGDLFAALNSIADDGRRNKLKRALHWFWRSTNTNDLRDQFLNCWIAIEHLESELKTHFGLPESQTKHPVCSKCGHSNSACCNCGGDLAYKASLGFAGYKAVAAADKMRDGLIGDLHGARSKLVHGGKAERPELETVVVETRDLLARAIFLLIGINPSKSVELNTAVLTKSLPVILTLAGEATVSDVPKLKEPHLQPVAYGKYEPKYAIDDTTDELNMDESMISHDFQGNFMSGNINKVLRIDRTHKVRDVRLIEDGREVASQ